MMSTSWAVMGLVTHAQAQDCSEWGTISSGTNPSTFVLNETYSFYVGAGATCGDVNACEWSLDEANAVGSLLQTTGSPVNYLAPASLEDCTPVSFQLFLLCPGAPEGMDTENITVQCTQADKDSLLAAPGATVSGGGCTQPTDTAVLLLPISLAWGILGRRRRDKDDEPKGMLRSVR